MAYFNFARLIKKYSTDFIVRIPLEGCYNSDGEWEEATTEEKTLSGAIISHRESKIFRAEGKITGRDKALYMLEPLENALHGAETVHGDKVYSIGDMLENGEFTGVWAYTLKYVSAFKDTRPDYDLTEEFDELEDRLDGVLAKPEETPPDDDDLSEDEMAEMLDKRLDGVLDDD